MCRKHSDIFSKKISDKKFSLQFLPNVLKKYTDKKVILYKEHKLKVSYLIDIVHSLLLKYYQKKENSFNLSSIILKDKYGYIYNYYISFLVEQNILVLQKKHMKGKNARVYKIDDSVLKSEITRFKNEDRILLKKYKSSVTILEREKIENNKIKPHIKKKLVEDLFSIEIDFTKSIFFLDSTIQDKDVYVKNKYSVECIHNNHIFFHFDSYGRMHTNFTILKSFIRKNCLLIDGDIVKEFDIKNSQPLFLNKIIEKNGLDSVDKNEYDLFKFLTLNNKFYQYFIENTEIKERQLVKKAIYKVLFGKNHKNKFDTVFETLFPTIHYFIKDYKKKNGDYRILAYELQNLESDMIFNKIINEIIEKEPNIKLFTVHDSIICPIKYEILVGEIFHRNINQYFDTEKDTISEDRYNIYSYV